MKNNSVQHIVNKRICVGCGSCVAICPNESIRLVYGKRYNYPQIDNYNCNNCGKCLKVCPSVFLIDNILLNYNSDISDECKCFLAYAVDENIRFDAASGGFITGLLNFLLSNKFADGAVVTACQGENSVIAKSFIARDKQEVLSARGSKYAPVSNCIALSEIMTTPGRYVFVGTPCMLQGVSKIQEISPVIKERIILKIGFVCAGMASRVSTTKYIEQEGKVDLKKVYKISYRGRGWPGRFTVYDKSNEILMDRPLIDGSLTHVVGRDHYLRCKNCIDHWARYADICVSDPWTEEMMRNEKKGQSAVLVRTDKGKKFLSKAVDDKEICIREITKEDFINFNKHLIMNPEHEWNSWMYLYQIVFLKRLKFLPHLIKYFLKYKKIVGLRTTIKAKFNNKYYE